MVPMSSCLTSPKWRFEVRHPSSPSARCGIHKFINLTGIAGLQNLTNSQVVTFKIVIFTPQAANSVEFDDITVKGNITPRPETPYENAGKVFFRVKQQ